MPKVDISINGRLYAVACDAGQESRVRDLAGMIDQRVRQLGGPTSNIGEPHLLVLAGLMLADELTEAKARGAQSNDAQAIGVHETDAAAELPDQELLVAAVEHLTDRIAVIADRLERA